MTWPYESAPAAGVTRHDRRGRGGWRRWDRAQAWLTAHRRMFAAALSD
ncbi:hypothetical protein OG336_11705 [[Kitasatospora] papulosa]|nr:hypothetical protein OG336_11705 [[Kitasatospora] papulosa]